MSMPQEQAATAQMTKHPTPRHHHTTTGDMGVRPRRRFFIRIPWCSCCWVCVFPSSFFYIFFIILERELPQKTPTHAPPQMAGGGTVASWYGPLARLTI